MTLNEGTPGQRLTIQRIQEDETLNLRDLVRLADLGLTPGHTLHIIKKAPLGDPIEIELLDYRLCLRKEQAAHIEVTPSGGGQA